MPKKFEKDDKVIDLILWYKGMLSIGGLWPTDTRGLKFYSLLVYFLIHTILVISDFIMIVGYLEPMVDNLGEMALLSMIMAKMIVLRYSSSLPKLIREGKADEENDYRDPEERRIYMSYINVGLKFSKLTLCTTILATVAYYLKAMQSYLAAEFFGATPGFVLPYHTLLFFNITDIRTYLLVYAYQGPMIYIFSCYTSIACFILSFIFHVCGQLSVLAYRIRHIKVARTMRDNYLELTFRDIIRKHNKIIWTSKTINGIFNLVLLDELIICTLIQGLCMYNILLNSSLADAVVLVSFLLYVSTMLLVMFGYCVAGDLLMQESMNFHDSCYECEWYDMPSRCKKSIIICMIRARIPLHLTGGGFYIYSLESFTGVVKSAVAYVSMLRQIL